MPRIDLGPIGASMNPLAPDAAADAAELERLGYRTIWLPGGKLSTLDPIGAVLRATERVSVGSAIIQTGAHEPATVAGLFGALENDHPGRFVVGLSAQQARPLAATRDYLDRLDATEPLIPPQRRMLAAIGPRKLALARDRTAGSLPLLVNPAYTAQAREILGPDSTLSVHQLVALETDADRARTALRGTLGFLVNVPGYVASFRAMGFTEEDITGLGDRLVDGVTSWGDVAAIRAGVRAHLDAGADQVTVSVLDANPDADPDANPRWAWRELAPALLE